MQECCRERRAGRETEGSGDSKDGRREAKEVVVRPCMIRTSGRRRAVMGGLGRIQGGVHIRGKGTGACGIHDGEVATKGTRCNEFVKETDRTVVTGNMGGGKEGAGTENVAGGKKRTPG